MFRGITAFVLIFSVTFANFTNVFIYAGFELNHEYIVTEFCENRDIPEMNCDGQCYLSKKLKQAEEKKGEEREAQKHNFQEAFLTEKVVLNSPALFIESFSARESVFLLPQPSFVIFHPPQV